MTRIAQTAFIPNARKTVDRSGRGMGFERQIIAVNDIYRRLGVAAVDKTDVKTQVVGNGQWARVVGKGPVDFIGTIDGGRTVAFDAKDCAGPRIELDRLEEHQLDYLGQVYALGGMAFVLVRFEYTHVYRVPVDVWADADLYHRYGKPIERVDGWKPKNAASLIMADMCPEWAVKSYDYLGALNDGSNND